MFRDSRNVVITGGQLTSIENNHEAGWKSLWDHAAAGAIFDSAERYPPGRCHPGTRQRIIGRIVNCIQHANSTQRVLWLYGPAGSGKSALIQSMCELLKESHPEMYGGSFFFARGDAERSKGAKLFVTLSYQLAAQFSSVRKEIDDALRDDISLPTKSIDRQLLSLIVNPLLRCRPRPSPPPILLVDGLDECENIDGIETQRDIIALISKSITKHNIPIRFIIASRPEYWIRDAFEASPLSDITFPLSLRDDLDADRDIRSYLTDEFEKIRLQNRRVMHSVVSSWPPANIINRFVEEASGQYIYASTILKFVGKSFPFTDPQKQLRIITTPGPHRASAFTELDRLYATILSAYPDWDTMKRVLAGLLAGANLTTIQVILHVDPADITLIMDALCSLIEVSTPQPPPEHEVFVTPIFGSVFAGKEKISFYHLTFREFLQDEKRSGPYYVDSSAIDHQVTSAVVFDIINRNLDQNYETEPHVSFNIGLLAYREMMNAMINKYRKDRDIGTLLPMITAMAERLQHLDFSRRMNHPGCFVQDMEWIDHMLLRIKNDYNFDEFSHKHNTKGDTYTSPDSDLRSHFLKAESKLEGIASSARKMGIRLLSLCNEFRITSTLIFIDIITQQHHRVPIKQLFAIPGNTLADTLSSLSQHRHILKLFEEGRSGWCISFIDLKESQRQQIDEGWLSRSEWRNQHVSLISKCLKLFMNNLDNEWEHWVDTSVNTDTKHLLLAQFFNNVKMSDIRGNRYFAYENHLSFLSIMIDSRAWSRVLPSRPGLWTNVSSVIGPVLCWFNRQLINPCTLKLMEDHDAFLPQKMKKAMNTMFQHCFVPIFTTPYFSELRISTLPEPTLYLRSEPRSIRIGMLPMSHSEEPLEYSPPENHDNSFFHPVHIEIFGMTNRAPILDRSCWYPYLAAYLLNILVKYLYSRAYPTRRTYEHLDIIVISFPFILQCMPYAETSTQNLDALRAIKYLSEQADLAWTPPRGFCLLTLEFLKRYEQSVLPPQEFHGFELWFANLRSLEI